LDFNVCVSDPAATREYFPDAETLHAQLEAVRTRISPRSYVVIATQGAYDEEALAAVIDTTACYLGLVASGPRAATIFQYLCDKGVQPELLQRVKCPAGLQLGAVTPPEIGFSIMAEILQLRRSNKAIGEARAAVPATAMRPEAAVMDPVCGMTVQATGARYTSAYDGKTFLFCSLGCKEHFDHEPARYSVSTHAG
jgi:xanthine dehydrogenase accessory factor